MRHRLVDQRRGVARALSAAAMVLVLAPPGSAPAVTFGPDLTGLPANSDPAAVCGTQLPDFPLLGPANRQSCMWSYFNAGAGNGLGAPATGTVTAVRVKVGAITGKMRVNVIRFLFQQTGDTAHPISAGPFLEAYGPEFTPTANAITTVPASLAMRADPTPDVTDTKTIAVYDYLALEVEASDVPVPVFASPGALTYRMYPGPTLTGTAAPSPNTIPNWTGIGGGVLMNADLTPDHAGGPVGGGPPAPAPGDGQPTVPVVQLPAAAAVRGGMARVPIICRLVDCRGTLALRPLAGTAAKRRARVSYGTATFAIKAGATRRVGVRLTRAGRALLRTRRSAKVRAQVTFATGGGAPASATLTLRRS